MNPTVLKHVKLVLHCCFSFIIGWINCIMLLRYRCFATMMVGNTVLMGVAMFCQDNLMDGDLAKELCPAQFESLYYLKLIGLYLLGAFVHGLIEKKLGWTPRAFAPVIVVAVGVYKILQTTELIKDYKYDLYLLAPIFGITGSVSAKGGIGGVPWAATGNMLNIAYHAASFFHEANEADASSCMQSVLLWVSMVAGVIMGTFMHGELTLVLSTLALAVIFCVMSSYLPKQKDMTSEEVSRSQSERVQRRRSPGRHRRSEV